MNLVSKFLVLSLTLLCLEQPAFSIQLVNEARPTSAGTATTKMIERGGTVDSVNNDKKTLVVDGRNYSLAASPVVIHAASSKDTLALGSIKPGTKIRFNTTKNNYSAQDQIVEIWISETGKLTKRK